MKEKKTEFRWFTIMEISLTGYISKSNILHCLPIFQSGQNGQAMFKILAGFKAFHKKPVRLMVSA